MNADTTLMSSASVPVKRRRTRGSLKIAIGATVAGSVILMVLVSGDPRRSDQAGLMERLKPPVSPAAPGSTYSEPTNSDAT